MKSGSDRKASGDFQTPLSLARMCCKWLVKLGVNPDVIIEPTCGIGSFLRASDEVFPHNPEILGYEISPHYTVIAQSLNYKFRVKRQDFFSCDWSLELNTYLDSNSEILFLGNPPWVTISRLTELGYAPDIKRNKGAVFGVGAGINGKSNFDVSEWMVLKLIDALKSKKGHIALILKESVARKLIQRIERYNLPIKKISKLDIDAKKAFEISVSATMMYFAIGEKAASLTVDEYDKDFNLKTSSLGVRQGRLVSNAVEFDNYNAHTNSSIDPVRRWRSGIKHDCSSVLELSLRDNKLVNKLGEPVDVESNRVFPLIKGSSVANHRIEEISKWVIVPKNSLKSPELDIKLHSPKLWKYLIEHEEYFAKRKSKIYQNGERFPLYGFGEYSFAPWKVATASMYKRLNFCLVGPMQEKPVFFDDTVYFSAFTSYAEAKKYLDKMKSERASRYLGSQIFWDNMRPVNREILESV